MSDDSQEDMGDATLEICVETPAKDSAVPFSNRTRMENKFTTPKVANSKGKDVRDPVQVLQLSQPYFVADSMIEDDDDDISLIPPTPSNIPIMIPSTPEPNKSSTVKEKTVVGNKEEVKETIDIADDDDDDDDDWIKPTQPLFPEHTPPRKKPEVVNVDNDDDDDETFADPGALFDSVYDMPTQRCMLSPDPRRRSSSNGDDIDESWNLKLSVSQTQPLEVSRTTKRDSVDGGKAPATEQPVEQECEKKEEQADPMDIQEIPIVVPDEQASPEKSKNDETELANKTLTPTASQSERHVRETTPEEIRLFAEIESIVRAARASEDTSDSATPVEKKNTSSAKEAVDSEDSDLDEIAPSQTSTRSVNVSRKISESSKSKNRVIVPDTQPNIETSEKNGVQHIESIPETGALTNDVHSEPEPTVPMKRSRLGKKAQVSAKKLKETQQKSTESSETSGKSSPDANAGLSSHSDMLPPGNSYVKRSPLKRKSMDKKADVSPKSANNSLLSVESLDFKFSTPGSTDNVFGAFSDRKSLESIFASLGVSINEEKIKVLTSPQRSAYAEVELGMIRLYAKGNKICGEYLSQPKDLRSKVDISPASSGSTATTKTSSFISTSGEMGDISSSISSKSISSSASSTVPFAKRSQELNFRTSTQNSDSTLFSPHTSSKQGVTPTPHEARADKLSQDDFQNPVVLVSPLKKDVTVSIKKSKKSHNTAAADASSEPKLKRKRPGRKPSVKKANLSSTDSTDVEVKRPKTSVTAPDDDTPVSTRKKGSIKTSKKAERQESLSKRGARRKILNVSNNTVETNAEIEIAPAVPVAEDDDSSALSFILPGMRVMTRWKDSYYYPGIVLNQELDGKWRVQFDDGAARIVTQLNLLKIPVLEEGTQVHALSPDGYFDPGTVSSHYREGNDTGYVIELQIGVSRRYKRGSVILSTEQARKLMNPKTVVPTMINVNLDNIVGGKRKRSSIPSSDSATSSPTVKPQSATKASRNKKADPNLDTTESSANEASAPKTKALDIPSIDASDVEEKAAVAAPPTPKEKKLPKSKKGPKQKEEKKVDKQKEEKKVGKPKEKKLAKKKERKMSTKLSTSKPPVSSSSDIETTDAETSAKKAETSTTKIVTVKDAVPVRSTKLFQDYAFLLTSTAKKRDDSYSDSETTTFDKEHMCKLITSGGGLVCETYEEAQKCSKKKIVLLANTFVRTIKYLQCVAANIPCIQHHWVQNCCLTRKCVEPGPYMLPTGYSLTSKNVIHWHGKTDIFTGLKIVITSEKKSDFVNIWTPVLLAAKADLVQKWNLPSFQVLGTAYIVDLIVTNPSCPKDIVNVAKSGKIPIVSSEYIIQCIINGHRLPYNKHPKFAFDYTE